MHNAKNVKYLFNIVYLYYSIARKTGWFLGGIFFVFLKPIYNLLVLIVTMNQQKLKHNEKGKCCKGKSESG
jgi:hypothetical protein